MLKHLQKGSINTGTSRFLSFNSSTRVLRQNICWDGNCAFKCVCIPYVLCESVNQALVATAEAALFFVLC